MHIPSFIVTLHSKWPYILRTRLHYNTKFHFSFRIRNRCGALSFLLIIYCNRSQLRPLAPQLICSKLLKQGGRRLTSLSGDSRETSFLFQHLSMLIQRFNSGLITDSCFSDEDPDIQPPVIFVFSFQFLTPGSILPGIKKEIEYPYSSAMVLLIDAPDQQAYCKVKLLNIARVLFLFRPFKFCSLSRIGLLCPCNVIFVITRAKCA